MFRKPKDPLLAELHALTVRVESLERTILPLLLSIYQKVASVEKMLTEQVHRVWDHNKQEQINA